MVMQVIIVQKACLAGAQVQILKLLTNCLLVGGLSQESPNLHYLRFQDC